MKYIKYIWKSLRDAHGSYTKTAKEVKELCPSCRKQRLEKEEIDALIESIKHIGPPDYTSTTVVFGDLHKIPRKVKVRTGYYTNNSDEIGAWREHFPSVEQLKK